MISPAALTSHQEQKAGHVLHEVMVLAAAQHPYDPAEQDDGHRHPDEAGGHPLEVCIGIDRFRFNEPHAHSCQYGLSACNDGKRENVRRTECVPFVLPDCFGQVDG